MQGQGDDDTEKTHEPTPKKLLDARKKGEIARSADVNAAAAFAGLWLAFLAFGAGGLIQMGSVFMGYMSRADDFSAQLINGPAHLGIGRMLQDLVPPMAAGFVVPLVCVVLAVFAQNAFVFAPTKIAPKLSRLSPLQNAKNKFGLSGLFEFGKSFAKLMIYSLCLGLYLRAHLADFLQAVHQHPGLISAQLARTVVEVLAVIVGVSVALAVVDYLWQRADFLRRNRMSHKDLRDEQKEAEGDPHFKSMRRARAQEIAMSGALTDVPKASVVIVNPTHYAVALQYQMGVHGAPVCLAKGVDAAAQRMREIAIESGVPLRHDPATARALYATVEVGQEIQESHYAAVAAAIRFAEAMRHKARRAW